MSDIWNLLTIATYIMQLYGIGKSLILRNIIICQLKFHLKPSQCLVLKTAIYTFFSTKSLAYMYICIYLYGCPLSCIPRLIKVAMYVYIESLCAFMDTVYTQGKMVC